MNTFIRFFYEFISIFVGGIVDVGKGIYNGVTKMFNIFKYKKILDSYIFYFSRIISRGNLVPLLPYLQ